MRIHNYELDSGGGYLETNKKIKYRITSNKRPGRLLNFLDFRRGIYSREAFKRGGRLLKNLRNDTKKEGINFVCLLYTSPSPRDGLLSRMPSSA